jgi:hypothetical protein
MPTPTYTPLANVTLGSSSSSVTFSSIPATYRDLILVVNGTVDTGTGLRLRFNNDSGNNYSYAVMAGLAAGETSISGGGQNRLYPAYANQSSGQRFTYTAQIMDYSATDKHKTVLFRDNSLNGTIVSASAQRWANNTAVTQLNLLLDSGNYNAGTTAALYGIAS